MYICKENQDIIYFMRKINFLVVFSLITSVVFAQFTVDHQHYSILNKTTTTDTVTVILIDSIVSSTVVTYVGTGTNINWYEYSDLINSKSNQPDFSPEDATGYILDVDGKKTYIWFIDYHKLLPTYTSFIAEDNPKDQCEYMNLLLSADIPLLKYKAYSGNVYLLPRTFTINYKTQTWSVSWSTIQAPTQEINLPTNSPIIVPAPLCDTKFTLSGDQYAEDLGFKPDSITSPLYSAVAVKCYPTSIVTTRTATNEGERPTNTTDVSGSAPLEMQFKSNANVPVTIFYKWEIYKNDATEPFITHNDQDINYTFTDYGTYHVKLTVSNSYCSYLDSTITITTSTSAIYAPNVFTPNGDGLNDEFRVAYKSITSFEGWVYNRWGRLVFHWTDPQKGWDGNIGGRKATPGAYFYVIKALGSDFNPNSQPNKITHLRPGEYLLKGDINLLRGIN